MQLGRLNHVGVAVPDMERAIAFYREVMGAQTIGEPFDLPTQGVRVCLVDTPHGGTQLELIAPLSEQSPLTGFLERNPLGGQHHLAFEVPDIHAAVDWFIAQGRRILGDIRIGAHGTPVFFVHPKDMGGLLIEIMEPPPAH
jgi:methylmalonyl-CoA/ethylmalonyl-CoA epimerase